MRDSLPAHYTIVSLELDRGLDKHPLQLLSFICIDLKVMVLANGDEGPQSITEWLKIKFEVANKSELGSSLQNHCQEFPRKMRSINTRNKQGIMICLGGIHRVLKCEIQIQMYCTQTSHSTVVLYM